MAMQGLGKPGVNFGNLQWGTPVDFNFYFPGYADGGMSGDLEATSMAVELYQRMPQLPTMNTPLQKIPRIWMPEAIIEGKAEGGYPWNGKSIEAQFAKFSYPMAGHAPVRMLFKYGGSLIPTMNNTNRHVRMFQSENLEFIVSQAIWFEGDTWKLENPTRLIEIGKTKAFRFSHIVDCEGFEAGPLPPWCEELDELSLHIKTPRRFEQIDAYNQAVQTMWFGEGRLSITVDLCGLEDLDMAYYLHSLTPNDLDFYLVCHQQGRAVENALYANPLTFRFLNLGQE